MKFSSVFFFLILLGSFLVLAGNVDKIYFENSDGDSLTGVDYVLYVCADSDCTSVNGVVVDMNSGSNDYVTYEYSSTSRLNYGAYIFKECYLPHEDGYENWGDGGSYSFTYELSQAEGCKAPIDSMSVTNDNYVNEPIVISMSSTIEADVHSDFENSELEYVPLAYEDFYTSETTVLLEIFDSDDNVVYTDTLVDDIYMEDTINVQFSWTPSEEGNYTIRLTTDVTDCECSSSIKLSEEKQIVVWRARPQDECYTLIQDLEANPLDASEGDAVTILFNKLSNYADDNYDKEAIATFLTYEITNSDNDLVYSGSEVVGANSNAVDYREVTLNWVPSEGGIFNIKVTGVGSSSLCDGKANPEDVEILGYFVDGSNDTNVSEDYGVVFVVTDLVSGDFVSGADVEFGSLNGQTDSSGEVEFVADEGSYDWEVSAVDYYSVTGNSYIDSDRIIYVQLNSSSGNQTNETSLTDVYFVYPTGGEELDGDVNIRWNATNSLGRELLIDLFYSRNGGSSWSLIVDDEVNDGVYSWNTENVPDDDEYMLKIVAKNLTFGDEAVDYTGLFGIENDDDDDDDDDDRYSCRSDWVCGSWGSCTDGWQTRECIDLNDCALLLDKPLTGMACSSSVLGGKGIVLYSAEETFESVWMKYLIAGLSAWIILVLLLLIFLRFRD